MNGPSYPNTAWNELLQLFHQLLGLISARQMFILNNFYIPLRDTIVFLKWKLLSAEGKWPLIANSLTMPDSLLAELLRDCWMNFNETWWEDGQWTKRKSFNFGVVLIKEAGGPLLVIQCYVIAIYRMCYLGRSWEVWSERGRGERWYTQEISWGGNTIYWRQQQRV